jgi:hypothetical protein
MPKARAFINLENLRGSQSMMECIIVAMVVNVLILYECNYAVQ